MNIHYERTNELQKKLKEEKIEGIIFSTPKEVFFLTGFHQDRTFLLVTQKEVFAFIPKMFFEHFSEKCSWAKISIYENPYDCISQKISNLKLTKVVFDSSTVLYDEAKKYIDMKFEAISGFLKEFRMTKKKEELENLKKSCQIAAQSYKLIKNKIKKGIKEIEIARELEYIMKKMGASERSFETIVAFGPNSALPHHETSERKLKNNEVVLIDFGCIYKRYCSDMTRTFFYGKPTDEFKKVYKIVEEAQKKGISTIKEGVLSNEIDKICREIISINGYGQYFTHGTGHGVGLEIHEEPWINPKTSTKLKEGMTITIEPGIYLYGKFGVRIEDTVYVRKNSHEVLTLI
ncbi:MAG: aminopeptidase P family protein [Elusimicrobiales bacterium]|nr:aminopeptidase P family protein [Elusimicrobiales bacterium]